MILMVLVAMSAGAKKQKQLVVLHTNDTHSCIMPLKSALPDTAIAGRGDDQGGAREES